MEDDRTFDHIPLQSSVTRHDYNNNDDDDDDDDDNHTLPSPPPAASAMIGRRFARRVERACCTCATYFPLAFVFTLTTWAVWVLIRLGADTRTSTVPAAHSWVGPWCSAVGVWLYAMLLWSYLTAVFTPPGSTTNDQGYATVPASVTNPSAAPRAGGGSFPLTVKANGEMRFCKKCQARKPDRAHHCSTCQRCVLKMDHHCPWLATCIGLRNGKAFVLFLIYTSVYATFAFAVSGSWVWAELSADATYAAYGDSFMPVQYIMLCVIGGIIGLVVGLFTAWHILLACRGQTTIECLETTRYQSPLRTQAVHLVGEGVMAARPPSRRRRPRLPDEEQGLTTDHDYDNGYDDDGDDGDDYPDQHSFSNGHDARPAHLNYSEHERYRAQQRHQAYLDEQDSKKMPHAFDLGVRRNLLHMFGPSPWLWALPIGNTTGDGWTWEPSPKWLAARDRNDRERAAQRERERAAGWGVSDDSPLPSPPAIITTHPTPPRPNPRPQPPSRNRPAAPSRYNNTSISAPAGKRTNLPGMAAPPSKADRILGRNGGATVGSPGSLGSPGVHLQRLNTSGRAVRNDRGLQDHGYVDDDDDDDDDDNDDDDGDDELDNTSEEETARSTQRSFTTAAAAAPPVVLPQPSSSTQRSLSPLRARWMPDPASGLLRKAAGGGSSGATSPTTPGTEGGGRTASPTFAFAATSTNTGGVPNRQGHNNNNNNNNNNMDDDGGVD